MRHFEQTIEAACLAEEIPGAVLLAADRSGKLEYARPFGKRSVRPGADQSPLRLDTTMWIASCTKVVTALAAMQCVERGLLALDEPIYDVLPELRGKPVIREIDGADGSPVMSAHTGTITLRLLLNHSSGLVYDETHPLLMAWHGWRHTKPNRDETVMGRFGYPLAFEPGTSWCYGPGLDWAGLAIERVTGEPSLQTYFEKHIFGPVGAHDIVFSPHMKRTRPEMVKRLADLSKRDPDSPTPKVKRSNARLQWNDSGECMGGLGLFSDSTSYMKVLKGLLTMDTDGVLLKKTESVEEFYRPSLTKEARATLNDFLESDEFRDGMGNIPKPITVNWCLGGIINEQDVPGGRRAGAMAWGGLPNLIWSVDRKAGVCAFYAGQVVPPGDARVCELNREFEKGVYEMHSSSSAKL